MDDQATLTASVVGNPDDGQYVNPWPGGHPAVGERVAIFMFEMTDVDGVADVMRSYHVAPIERATVGPIGPIQGSAQGVAAHWAGCGTGTVLRLVDSDGDRHCEVVPDDPGSS